MSNTMRCATIAGVMFVCLLIVGVTGNSSAAAETTYRDPAESAREMCELYEAAAQENTAHGPSHPRCLAVCTYACSLYNAGVFDPALSSFRTGLPSSSGRLMRAPPAPQC